MEKTSHFLKRKSVLYLIFFNLSLWGFFFPFCFLSDFSLKIWKSYTIHLILCFFGKIEAFRIIVGYKSFLYGLCCGVLNKSLPTQSHRGIFFAVSINSTLTKEKLAHVFCFLFSSLYSAAPFSWWYYLFSVCLPSP